MAAVYEGFRYILYKESWMSKSNYWSKMAILAHEVGHHINGHTLSGYSLQESRKVELEADDWAGYAMAKLGASLAQTLQITSRFQTGDDTNSTHPNRAKRVAALTAGWNIGNGTTSNKPTEKYTPDNSNMSASEYFNRAYDKDENGDYYGAIADYSKAIELAPNNSSAYNNRGVAKDNLKDDYGAIADYSKAIELNPDYALAYKNRGSTKYELKDYYGAIADCSKAIELAPNSSRAYKYKIRGHAKYRLEDYYGAIADYTKVIELNPDNAVAYYDRGEAKARLRGWEGFKNERIRSKSACADLRKAANLGHIIASKLVNNRRYCR